MAFIYEIKQNKKFEDLTGKIFGRLTVLKLDEDRNTRELNRKLNGEIKQNKTYYICQCSCGDIKSISKSNLKNGHTISCGCYMKEQQSKVAMKYFKKYNKYDLTNNYGICYLADTHRTGLCVNKLVSVCQNDEICQKRGYLLKSLLCR